MAEKISARAYHFSIVAMGPMNPRLHHPFWYHLIGAISEEEQAAALASPSLLVIPPLSRFEVSGITIACQENRWEIVTTQPALRQRIRDITALVFKKLFETPIPIYGFNNNFELETKVPSVRRCLADAVLALDLGLKPDGDGTATITFVDKQKARKLQVAFMPSGLSEEVLSLAHNTEYTSQDEVAEKKGYFDIGELIAKHFDPDYDAAVDLAAQMVAKLEHRCGGK